MTSATNAPYCNAASRDSSPVSQISAPGPNVAGTRLSPQAASRGPEPLKDEPSDSGYLARERSTGHSSRSRRSHPLGANKINSERSSPRGMHQQGPSQGYRQVQCDQRPPAGGTPFSPLDFPVAYQGPADRSVAPSGAKSTTSGSKGAIDVSSNLNRGALDEFAHPPRDFASQLREHEERMAHILERQRHIVVADVVRSLDKFAADVTRSLDERLGSAKVNVSLPSSPVAPVSSPAAPARSGPSPLKSPPVKAAAQEAFAAGIQGKQSVLDDLEESLKVEKKDDLEGAAFRLRLRHAETTLGSWAGYLVHADQWWCSLKEPERSGPIYNLVSSRRFEALCTLVIFINAIFICYTTNRNIQPEHLGSRASGFMLTFEVFFIVFYSVEMALKLIVHKQYLFINNEALWNMFEMFLIVFAIVDQLLEHSTAANDTVNILFLRSLRLFKVFRLLRAFHMVKELRLMLDCVIGCFSSLFWAFVMLAFFMGIFSLIFVQGAAGYLESRSNLDESSVNALYATFGSVQQGMLTLFKAATGGTDWSIAYEIILPTGFFYTVSYIFFIVFFMISVWNIVTSLFVEKALGLAQPDMANMMYEQQKQDIEDSEELLELMRAADKDNSGTISLDEFLVCYHQEDFRSFFHIRGIDIKDGALFFKLLATISGTSEVDLHSFVSGCMRLKGNASGLDAHMLRYQVLQLHRLCEQHFAEPMSKGTAGVAKTATQDSGVAETVALPPPSELPMINSLNSPRGIEGEGLVI